MTSLPLHLTHYGSFFSSELDEGDTPATQKATWRGKAIKVLSAAFIAGGISSFAVSILLIGLGEKDQVSLATGKIIGFGMAGTISLSLGLCGWVVSSNLKK